MCIRDRLRIDEDKQGKGTLSLILISQEEVVLNLLEGAVISRLGVGNHIRLSGYSKEGLFEIAKQRAALSLFSESYDDKILHLIANSAASKGDARNVLHLIEGAAKSAEKEGYKFVHPFDGVNTLQGSATLGLEIVNQMKNINTKIVTPKIRFR